jgi:hypothetical protein
MQIRFPDGSVSSSNLALPMAIGVSLPISKQQSISQYLIAHPPTFLGEFSAGQRGQQSADAMLTNRFQSTLFYDTAMFSGDGWYTTTVSTGVPFTESEFRKWLLSPAGQNAAIEVMQKPGMLPLGTKIDDIGNISGASNEGGFFTQLFNGPLAVLNPKSDITKTQIESAKDPDLLKAAAIIVSAGVGAASVAGALGGTAEIATESTIEGNFMFENDPLFSEDLQFPSDTISPDETDFSNDFDGSDSTTESDNPFPDEKATPNSNSNNLNPPLQKVLSGVINKVFAPSKGTNATLGKTTNKNVTPVKSGTSFLHSLFNLEKPTKTQKVGSIRNTMNTQAMLILFALVGGFFLLVLSARK